MNAYVKYFIACLVYVNIFVGSSLDVTDDGGKTLTERIELSEDDFDMSYLECTSDGCKLVPKIVQASAEELKKPGPWEVEDEPVSRRPKRRIFLPDNRLRVREQSVGRFPFNSAVAIRVNGEVKCSGVALLKPRFFLTAAHCVQPDVKWKDIEVGVLNMDNEMQWAKVNNTRAPPIWKKANRFSIRRLRFQDYAVLETMTPLPATPMRIGYVGMDERGNEIIKVNKTYIYFNAFDDEKFADHLNMRFCQVKKVWSRVLYSRCDTVPKTAGAGVYLRMRNKNTGRVERKVIAIATGDYGLKADLKFSAALRIRARMIAHICVFVTGSYNGCAGL